MLPNTISHTGAGAGGHCPSPRVQLPAGDVTPRQRIRAHMVVHELDPLLEFAASSTTDAWAIPKDASSIVDSRTAGIAIRRGTFTRAPR